MHFQSEEVIPFPVDKTILSTQLLGDNTAEDGTKTRRVLVAAAHRELVDGVVAAVEGAGLTVEGVDLVSLGAWFGPWPTVITPPSSPKPSCR